MKKRHNPIKFKDFETIQNWYENCPEVGLKTEYQVFLSSGEGKQLDPSFWEAFFICADGRYEMKQIQRCDQSVRYKPIRYKLKSKILVVDDNIEVANGVRDILVNEGFDVEVAGNGKGAMEFLRKGQQFDLLITDMKMPEVDGLELLREIRYWKPRPPVIVLTGCPTVENGIQSITEGAYDYLVKPFKVEALVQVVQAALRSRSGREVHREK